MAILAAVMALGAFAQGNTPEMLKKKELFSKPELFENAAIFSSAAANVELIKDYEANPAAYASSQLVPIATCYMAMGNIAKARAALEQF